MMKLTESLITNLQVLSLPQLKGIKKSLREFFYQSGVNIVFYSLLKEEESLILQRNISEAIKKQLWQFIKLENIKNEGMVKQRFIPFVSFYPQGYQEINDFLKWIAKEGVEVAKEKSKLDLKKPNLNKQLKKRTDFVISNIDKILIDWLRNVIGKGKLYKLSVVELMKYLIEKLEETALQKGEMIIRNEIINVLNMAEYETYSLNGIRKLSWKVAVEEESEKDCVKNGAVGYITLGSDFPSGHKYPPLRDYCSCFLMPYGQ